MNSNNALAIFVKAPVAGTVKTRLQPELTPEQSLQLYQAMTEDLIYSVAELERCYINIFFTPDDAGMQIQNWLGTQFNYVAQQGADLGERMLHTFNYLYSEGYHKIVLVGSDIPTLDSITVSNAFAMLNDSDLVFGPSLDGGYYLIGAKALYPSLFTNIAWSTDRVLLDTRNRALAQKLSITQLQLKSDIDRYEDVKRLWREISGKENPKSRRTYRALEKIFSTIN